MPPPIFGAQGSGTIQFGYTTGASLLHYRMESGLFTGAAHTPIVADSLQNNIIRTEVNLVFTLRWVIGLRQISM